MIKENIVSILKKTTYSYPISPYNPDNIYKEFIGFKLFKFYTSNENEIYDAVRQTFISLGLDKDNIGTIKWNPLKDVIKPKDIVVIKPNLVIDSHPLGHDGVEAMITHASVIRPIIDYILLATNGNCEFTICDVPLQTANWENLIKFSGLKDLVKFYNKSGINIKLLDLRYEISEYNNAGVIAKRYYKIRDPKGYTAVDLKEKSYFYEINQDSGKLEITDYGIGTVGKHHYDSKNEYLIPKTILDADVFINVPKLKTHKKAGVTLSMKNLIGINADKSWIAHHRRGVDEYPKFNFIEYTKWYLSYYLKNYVPLWLTSFVYKFYQKIALKGKTIREQAYDGGLILMEGNWHGNDTLWRTILDLNNIIFFTDKEGNIKKEKQREYLTVIDGIIGMDREAPMEGRPKKSGVIIGGFHPVYTDYVTSYIMGFNYKKIPAIKNGFNEKHFNLSTFKPEKLIVNSNIDWENLNLGFIPAKGWQNHIER